MHAHVLARLRLASAGAGLTAGIAVLVPVASSCSSDSQIQGTTPGWQVDASEDSSQAPGGNRPGDAAIERAPSDAPSSETGDATGIPGDEDAGDAAPPVGSAVSPYDWVGVIGTGQSLSVGVTAGTPISTTQPFKNMKLVDNGPDPKYPIASDAGMPKWATAPLVELIRGKLNGTGPGYGDAQYPENIFGETPHSGMANALSALWKARGAPGDYVTAHTVVGWSGHCLVDLGKEGGKRAYPASLNEARVWRELAMAAGKTYGVGGIVLTHGECDRTNLSYGTGLYQFWQDYNTDLKAITGQTSDVALLVSQQSVHAGATSTAVQVWQAGVAHPGKILCTGPKYQYQYSPGGLHLPAAGYERLGEKYAEVFDIVVNQRKLWKPLQPNRVTRAGAVVTVDFDVPNPPLVWDAHLAPPHQTANAQWKAGNGFEVSDSNGNALAIGHAAIQGSSVILTLSADPGAGKVTVGYALTEDGTGDLGGEPLGLHGLLRDSDEFTGYDAETIEAQATSGSAVVTSVTPGAFSRRTGFDIMTGAGLAPNTVVLTHDTDSQVTLSAPWSGSSGKVMLSFRHDQRNYCVHFSMGEM